MALIKEFREFAVKGDALDLAVGVIIGAAFGRIITALVDDILMPPVGMLIGKQDFSNYFVTLSPGHYATLAQAKAAGAATLNYGLFINELVTFIIVAFVIFMVVKQANRLRGPVVAPSTRPCPECSSEIPLAATRCRFCTQPVAPVNVRPPADALPLPGRA